MSNLAINTALKTSNFLNLINIHSKNVFDNIILNSDLNGAIIAGSQNVWNLFNGEWARSMIQNNTIDKYGICVRYIGWDRWSIEYPGKSALADSGVRVLIKYREQGE